MLASSFRPVTADHLVPGFAWNGGLCVVPGTHKYDDQGVVEPDTSGASRALRGGSWYRYPDLARADFRDLNLPDYRHDLRGFRLLSSVPIDAVR